MVASGDIKNTNKRPGLQKPLQGMPRTQKIRATQVVKGVRAVYSPEKMTTVSKYPADVKICIERSRLVTESYKLTEGQPEIIRRARALEHFINNMTIYIDPYQLIVGNETSEQCRLPIFIEIYDWLREGLDTDYKDLFYDEDREELRGILEYWRGKSIPDRWKAVLPDDVQFYTNPANLACGHMVDIAKGRPSVNFEKFFKIGLRGIIKEANEKLDRLKAIASPKMSVREYIAKRHFYEAVIISCKAIIHWANRYAELAANLAETEADKETKKELEEIAESCNWVPENPPRTLHEALQFFYFIHLAQRLEISSYGAGYRFDLLMNPFYLKDLRGGRITKEKAQELLECLWLKLDDLCDLAQPQGAGLTVGSVSFQNFALGGLKADGSDASNEMSRLMLDATFSCRTREPALLLRYHDDLPNDLIDKAIDLMATGHGMPALFNDKIAIPFLKKVERIPERIANNYTIISCVKWAIPGKSRFPITMNAGVISTLKCLELALNRGVDKLSGKQTGYPTKDAKFFKSLEDVEEAYLKQVDHFAKILTTLYNTAEVVYSEYLGRPFSSALVDGGLEKGLESIQNTYIDGLTIVASGCTNVANSLAAIKSLVFEKRTATMENFLEALKNNWVGFEELRQRAINQVPKFGNDDPYVDELMRWVQIKSNEIFKKYKGVNGDTYELDASVSSSHFGWSLGTGATPDGRRDFETYADGTVSPAQGTDKRGPTAVLNSVAKLSPLDTGWNHLLNQKFLPQYVNGDYREIFKSYIKSWSDLPIWHIQFNMISKKTLEDAQKNPENYSNLVVRVAGYSAYFVHLSKDVQDDIIKRTEQCFM